MHPQALEKRTLQSHPPWEDGESRIGVGGLGKVPLRRALIRALPLARRQQERERALPVRSKQSGSDLMRRPTCIAPKALQAKVVDEAAGGKVARRMLDARRTLCRRSTLRTVAHISKLDVADDYCEMVPREHP